MRKILVAAFAVFASIIGSAGFAEERINPFHEDFVIPKTGVKDCETVRVLTEAYPEWNKAKIWHPTANKGKVIQNRAQVISYCDKWSRHEMGDFGGSANAWRGSGGPVNKHEGGFEGIKIFKDYDVDGNGKIDDGEVVASYPWSMSNPMGIRMWPFGGVFPEITSRNLYGGASAYLIHAPNARDGQNGGGFAEMGINYDHQAPGMAPGAEDHPLNIMPNAKHPKSWVQAYYVFAWKKEDFLNNGDKHTVTFDDQSRFSSIVCRAYWCGWHDSRMIVQDGSQWYISDDKQFDQLYPRNNAGEKCALFGKKKDGTPRGGIDFFMYPTKATWAEYNPEEYKIHFDHENATFAKHEFKDVQAIGWYIGKDRKTIGEQAHAKWYGVGAEAVINSPEQGSVHIDMKEIEANGETFFMSTCEVPYALYKKIHKWGDVPWNQLDVRYVYRNRGDMGSMAFGEKEHTQDEPVANIDWYDALLWCNTLSEYEGKEPVYYEDAEFSEILRGRHMATTYKTPERSKLHLENPVWDNVVLPKVYVKWAADGHRLPTVSEWKAARGQRSEVRGQKSEGTVAVGSGEANENGMYDMAGNVWELVWTHGDVYDPANSKVTALGGGFQQTDTPAKHALSPYGDTPWNGNANIGMRLVRKVAGSRKPANATAENLKNWSFTKGERTEARLSAKDTVKEDNLDMVKIPAGTVTRYTQKYELKIRELYASKYETTYAKWQKVLNWAEANGYEFSMNGDMGSMYYLGHAHKASEPVTSLQWFDMIVWCNALSEMEGREPVFYEDVAKTVVMRKSLIYRHKKPSLHHMYSPVKAPEEKYIGGTPPTMWYFVKWDADGYRLPTIAEAEYLLNGGGKKINNSGEYAWSVVNSGGTTHPVGTKKANGFGLYDTVGNVFEWTMSQKYKYSGRIRPQHLDINNPKQSVTAAYGVKNKVANHQMLFTGGSWIWDCDKFDPMLKEHSVTQNAWCYYPDFGFRAIRCDTGTHPEDGLEELKSSLQIQINKEHWNNGKTQNQFN